MLFSYFLSRDKKNVLSKDNIIHVNGNNKSYLLYICDYINKSSLSMKIIFFYLFIENLCNGKFHQHLRDVFAPQVVRYVDLMESSIAQSIHKGFEKERWDAQG